VFVQDLVRRHTDQPVWMGGYDAAQKGMWLWSDGSAVDHFYWEEDEPSNSGQGENCMELHTGAGQGWNDVSCGELRFYVCSMETRSGLAALPSQKQAHERGSGMYTRRLPARFYVDFCHQEALYLDRVITMLQNLSSIQPSAAVRQYLQSFHDIVNEEPIYWLVSLLPRALLRPYLAQHLPLGERTRSGPSPCLYPRLSLFPCPCYQWGGEDMKSDQRNQKDKSGSYYRPLLEKYQDVIDVYKAVNIFRFQMINEKALFTSR
ncbi:unnamed protein product, partial [Coregonus sp. 'balchen']